MQRSRLRALLQLRVEASSSSKRKRKKKRKKKLPKAAVRSSSGTSSSFVPAVRARDVFCDRHVRDVPGCLSLFGAFAVFPSFVGRAQDYMSHVVVSGSGTCKTGFATLPRAVFLFVVVWPKMFDIMAGTDQKHSYMLLLCKVGFTGYSAPRAVLPSLSSGP